MIDRGAFERISEIGGSTLLGRMIDLFLTNAPQRAAAARDGQARGDLKAVEQAVHSLKSSAGNLGATRLQALAGQLEELAEAGRAEEVAPLLRELEEVLGEVLVLLAEERKGLST